MFEVVRWGGQRRRPWKTVLSTEDEAAARERYKQEYDKMRQGCIRLYERVDGQPEKILEADIAPVFA